MEEITVFDVLRTVMLWLSPLILLEGIFLLLAKKEKLSKLEDALGKEIGGIKKRIAPSIETNIFTFQNWLVKRTQVVGVFFVVYAILIFVVLKK